MAAEFKPFGFEDGYCFGKMEGASGHSSSLPICMSRRKAIGAFIGS
jgi:hypothetical protein